MIIPTIGSRTILKEALIVSASGLFENMTSVIQLVGYKHVCECKLV